jgi:hypothetical protein
MSKEKPRFVVSTDSKFLGKLARNVVKGMERKVGLFTEVINDNGEYDFRVDFRLGGGMYSGYLLTELSVDEGGIESLKWILTREFPIEVKRHIACMLSKKHLIDEETLENLLEQYGVGS